MQVFQHPNSHQTHLLNAFPIGVISKPSPMTSHMLSAQYSTKASYRRMPPQEPALGPGRSLRTLLDHPPQFQAYSNALAQVPHIPNYGS